MARRPSGRLSRLGDTLGGASGVSHTNEPKKTLRRSGRITLPHNRRPASLKREQTPQTPYPSGTHEGGHGRKEKLREMLRRIAQERVPTMLLRRIAQERVPAMLLRRIAQERVPTMLLRRIAQERVPLPCCYAGSRRSASLPCCCAGSRGSASLPDGVFPCISEAPMLPFVLFYSVNNPS